MEFDCQAFASTRFSHREEAVPVPDLAPFFKGLEAVESSADKPVPVWTVRGLTGAELAVVNEAQSRQQTLAAVTEALMSQAPDEVAGAVKALLGHSDSVPDDLARRHAMLVAGSVKPVVGQQVAVKLAEHFPVEFYNLTNAIMRLTGEGAVPGKPRPCSSGQTSSMR